MSQSDMQISRVKRSKNEAQKAYDCMSHFYDRLAGPSEARFIQQGIEMLNIKPGETTLEIGCGTGKALVELYHRAGNRTHIYGLDLSQGMLQVTGSVLSKGDLSKNIHLLEGDGRSIPIVSGKFSAIFMSFTLELFDTAEIPVVLEECRRVLMQGGRLVVVAMHKTDRDRWIVRLYEWLHAHFPVYVDCRPIDALSMIRASGLTIEQQILLNMWGIPVMIALAKKHAKS